LGDPNFGARNRIDPKLAQKWRTVRLPRRLSERACKVAEQLNYELTAEHWQPAEHQAMEEERI
jgi:hypothetical protein